mgnify:CR=1 FL=1|jgi:hypothetical protein|tara:strand:+ start:973 stop:1440 length:468 start_codon:yes stop_codon:yes gene_type:complete
MGIGVYVEGWEKQPTRQVKVYQDERFPNLDDEDFAHWGCERDETGRYFDYEWVTDDPFPSMDFSNGHWGDFSGPLGLITIDCIGSAEASEVPAILSRCMRMLNSDRIQKQAVREGFVSDRFIDCGKSQEYVESRLQEFLELLKFAVDNGKGIHWG